MVKELKCSIVITLYNRTQFIEEALYSLEQQNIDKELFEVLIITNINLKLSRNFDLTLRIFVITDKTLANKIVQGIIFAKGNIITFLEDDDLYMFNRIEQIIKAFKKYPDLTLYHNNSNHFKVFSEKIIENDNNKFHQQKNTYYPKKELRVNEILFSETGADFNLSSMAFSRNFLLNYKESIQNLFNRYIDSFMFFLVLYFGNSIFLDYSIETLTRIHSDNSSSTITPETNGINTHGYSVDFNAIDTEFNKYGLIDSLYIKNFLNLRGMDDLMKSKSIKRFECVVRLTKAYKLQGYSVLSSDVSKKALIYILSPILMEKILNKYHKG